MPFESFNTFGPILKFQGEDTILQVLQTSTDAQYGSKIEQTANETYIKCIFEELTEEESVLLPGKKSSYDYNAYVDVNDEVNSGDRVIRFPNTDNEKTYEVRETVKYSVYHELHLKELK